jgi:enoyl-CoA hydratase/carnithine racemase
MEATQTRLVDYRVQGGVAVIALTNAPMNCYTFEMMAQLDDAILKARFDDDVHVIVLRGAGEKVFCAGADINMLNSVTPGFKYYFCLHANETLNRLEHTPKLVIAAMNGHTVGGGLEIAMAADLRVAFKNTTLAPEKQGRIGLPEVTLGVLPGTGGTQRLTRLVNKSQAIEMMVTGDLLSFEQAQALGIINRIVEATSVDEFMTRVMEFAASFCPPNKASKAVGRIKRSVQSGSEVPFESALAIERELQQQLFQSEDAKEGISAYVGKRKPNFSGR